MFWGCGLWAQEQAGAPRSPAAALSKAESVRVEVSPAERAYLAKLGALTVCPDPDWAPFEHVDEAGTFNGIARDFLDLLAERLGIEFTFVAAHDWQDAIARSRSGEVLILPFLNRSAEREQWLTFTEPLLVDPNVFVTREEHPYIRDMTQLGQGTIVLPRGTSLGERIRRDYPNLRLLEVSSEEEVFAAVSQHQADLTLRSLTIAAYTIRKQGLFNLKIAGYAPDQYVNHLRMGVLKHEPELRDILDRGIATITPAEREAIVNRHVNVQIVRPMDYWFVLRIAAALALLIGISYYWNYRLKQVNAALNESERSKSVLLANLPGIAYRCRYDADWTMEFVSEGCAELTGYRSDELLENRVVSYNSLIHPADREGVRERWREAAESGCPARLEYRIITADQQEKWVFEQGVLLRDDGGQIVGIEGLIIDITDRKAAEADREEVVSRLRTALAEVKTLRGIVPICSGCKRIRGDKGYWEQVEHYVSEHTDASFSHGLCPDCIAKYYPELAGQDLET